MRDQRGFTLVELLLAMAMSLVAAGAGLSLLGIVGQRNVENARHSDRVSRAQISLEAMTRELRQASWLQFQSSLVVDAQVPVRPTGSAPAVDRLVRYDCRAGTSCTRFEGPATTFPPPGNPAFDSDRIALASLRPGSMVFTPQVVDPVTGAVQTAYVNPTTIAVTLEIVVDGWERPIRLDDTVTLRNATTFAEVS
jgi:prepilin-type N-terminal cleavage/methylation domain-containing protein